MSASCTHISALLHALTALNPTTLQPHPNLPSIRDAEAECVPVTSLPCKWKAPKAKKDSTLPVASTSFEKHDYQKPVKRKVKLLNDFDPRPPEFRGQIQNRLPSFLQKVKGEELAISFLLDSSLQQTRLAPVSVNVNDENLQASIAAFKDTLKIIADRAREIERNTREQRLSSLWFSVRRYRITSSLFGSVYTRRPTTAPDNLVLKIIQPRNFSSPATQHGIDHEQTAVREYIAHQQSHGHLQLTVAPSGFLISSEHPFLGASPDGAVYDPANTLSPFGFLEVKCPYTARNILPSEACLDSTFCCDLDPQTGSLVLKRNHSYYCQIQGQMAIGERPWCDFVIYTQRGIHVQREFFDEVFWRELLVKLTSFYDNCVAPEIISPLHALGLPMRDLSKK